MIVTLNRQKNGFVQRLPGGTPGRYPFSTGNKAIPVMDGDIVFVDPQERGIINTLLASLGLKVGHLMGGHEYLIEEV